MGRTAQLDDCAAMLANTGLSRAGILKSTGTARHLERAEQGLVSPDTLVQYASDLRALTNLSSEEGTHIPVDFWDVRTPSMEAIGRGECTAEDPAPGRQVATPARVTAGRDEYSTVNTLSRPEYSEYVRLLGRCYAAVCIFKGGGKATAVATALSLLRETAGYVLAGHILDMTASRPGLKPEQQSVFLWQQIVTGTNRQIPYLRRDAYSHGLWGRFNVVEIWRYGIGSEISADEVWGLSGFAQRFIGDATNTNQIEHMTISAVAQMVLGLPVLLLDLLEELEWMLRRGTYAASQADKGVNRAVARRLRPLFRVHDPGPAIESLESALAAE